MLLFSHNDIILLILVVAAAVTTPIVLRLRRKSHAAFLLDFSKQEVCHHLRPALEWLLSRGHRVVRAGQYRRDMPLEIYLAPPFDPQQVFQELQLSDPAFVSERNVLGCREHFCELRPFST